MALLLSRMSRPSLATWSWHGAVIIAAIFAALSSPALAAETNFSGHYELADGKSKSDRMFTLDVTQKGDRADVSFSAAMADGSGAAPDGTGKGEVDDGVLSFKFKDSFNNEGTCTLTPGKGGFCLCITVMKVVDPGPFHFYGNIALKKISDKPITD